MKIITRKEAIEQGLKRYFTGKPCKHGHVSERYVGGGRCCYCNLQSYKENKSKIKHYARHYRQENKDKIAEQRRKYYQESKDEIAEQKRKYYQERKDRITERQRQWSKVNKDKIAERQRKYYQENPLSPFIRNSLARIQSNWKGGRAKEEQTLGYTYEQLKQRIECQFKEGMSWENRSEWHIDHIKPIKAFLDEGVTDPAIINALSNLQPLWAKDNLSKGAKWNE